MIWHRPDAPPQKTYARFCRAHGVRLVEDTLDCPLGHVVEKPECDDDVALDEASEGFETREVPAPLEGEELARVREGLAWVAGTLDSIGSDAMYMVGDAAIERHLRLRIKINGSRPLMCALIAATGVGKIVHIREIRYGYRCEGLDSIRLLLAIKPFLRASRPDVEKALRDLVK